MHSLRQLTLSSYLLVTGIATFAVLAAPWLVLYGFLLLIVPGLVLSVMPVAFGYGCAFAVLRKCVRNFVVSPFVLNASAVVMTISLGVIVAGVTQLEGGYRLHRFSMDSIEPAGKVSLYGDIWLNDEFSHSDCEALCKSLLRRPGIESVSVSDTGWNDFNALREGRGDPAANRYRLKQSPYCQNEIGDTLSSISDECLMQGNSSNKYDFIIQTGEWREWSDSTIFSNWGIRRPVMAFFAEIRSQDKVLARAWLPNVDALALPLRAFPTCGSTYETILCWSRSRLGSKPYARNATTPSELLGQWL
jgi:hypothetical protein